jgi:hypothetical protein
MPSTLKKSESAHRQPINRLFQHYHRTADVQKTVRDGSFVEGLWLLDARHSAATTLTRRKARADFGAMGIVVQVFGGRCAELRAPDGGQRGSVDFRSPLSPPGVSFHRLGPVEVRVLMEWPQ